MFIQQEYFSLNLILISSLKSTPKTVLIFSGLQLNLESQNPHFFLPEVETHI